MDYIDIIKRANSGDPDAIQIIRKMDLDNVDTIFNDDVIKYIQETSDQSYSMYFIGLLYDYGKWNEPESAIEWYQKAVKLGNADAMNELAIMYYNNSEVEKNYPKAIELLQNACFMGNSSAINNLALIYDEGLIIEKNRDMAIKLLETGCRMEDEVAMYNLACIYEDEGNYQKAMELYKRSAKLGDPDSMYELAKIYQNGNEKNYKKAVKWYKRAIDAGETYSLLELAYMYRDEQGVEHNYEEIEKLLYRAIELGNADAMHGNALRYHYGNGVKQNYEIAEEWYIKAINAGNDSAKKRLTDLYKETHQWIPLARFYLDTNNSSGFRKCMRKILISSHIDESELTCLMEDTRIFEMYENRKMPTALMMINVMLKTLGTSLGFY